MPSKMACTDEEQRGDLGEGQEVSGGTGGVGQAQARFGHSMALLMTGMLTRSAA